MAESYISELGDKLSHGVANTDGSRVKIIAPKLYTDGNSHPSIATALAGKLDKTTYEWNKEIAFGSAGKLCVGKFPMYDSNVTITVSTTTNIGFSGTIVIATQNINTSRGGSYSVNVFGDPNGDLSSRLKVKYSSGSVNFEVYIDFPSWSKNLIHIQAQSLKAAPTDIATSVESIPDTDLLTVTNKLDSKQNTLTTQTAYTSKGTATKVPQITTNSLGQVTGITEVTISGVTPSSHASSATTYGVGTTANYGHVKLATGDMNGATDTDGVAVSKNHTHSQYLPKSGGAMTGAITRDLGGGVIADTNLFAVTGSTDGFKVDYGASASDAAVLKMYTTDDSNAKISIGNYNSSYKEAIGISNGIPSVPTASAGTNTTQIASTAFVTTAVSNSNTPNRLYANQVWGGAFRTSLSPFDNYAFKNANCFHGMKPSAVKIEYSTDGGTTWIDYGLTDDQKVSIFSQYGGTSIYCGHNTHIQPGYTGSISGTKDLSNDNISNQRLRITICDSSLANEGTTSSTDQWLYCALRRIGIYMSTQSAAAGAHCVFEKRTSANFKSGTNTWVTVGDYKIQGDTGWNSIPCENATSQGGITFGPSDSQIRQIRFTIWSDTLSSSPAPSQTGNLQIYQIVAYSELLWYNQAVNTNMGYYGVPYTVSPSTGITNFPKGINGTASVAKAYDTSFTGTDSIKSAFNNKVDYTLLNNSGVIGNGAPAADCKAYWASTSMPDNRVKILYNVPGNEATLFFSRRNNYGSILKYGYADKYIYILRYNNAVWKSDDWEKISAGYADSAGSATKATQDSDGNAINATYFKSSGNVTLVSGTATKIGTQNGADVNLTLPTITDTKNTAGSTDTSSKIFLIGATSQAANPQTYSQDTTYVDTDATLASTKVRVAEKCTLQFNTTTNALDFVFA